MTIALFVIDTPMQVVNVKEALKAFNIEQYDIITSDVARADGYQQLQQLLTTLAPRKLLASPTTGSSIKHRIAAYAKHIPYLKSQQYTHVFFSNIRQHWQRDIVCSLPNASPVLMDDGNSTVMLYDLHFRHQRFFEFPQDTDVKRVNESADLRSHYQISTQPPESLTLFTIFALEPLPWVNIVHNPLSSLVTRHPQCSDQQVLLLGIGGVALNFISESRYIALLQQVGHKFKGKQITYIPHRITTRKTLDSIQQQTGFNVIRLDVPVELWLSREKKPPASLVSFFSASLSTCALSFPSLTCYSVDAGLAIWEKAKDAHVFNMPNTNNLEIIRIIVDYLRGDDRIKTLKI